VHQEDQSKVPDAARLRLLQEYWNIWKWLTASSRRGWSIIRERGRSLGHPCVVPRLLYSCLFPETRRCIPQVTCSWSWAWRSRAADAGRDGQGSAFGQMGSSRVCDQRAGRAGAAPFARCAGCRTGSTGSDTAFGDQNPGEFVTLGWVLAILSFTVVVVSETGRIPVDNPDTHLELTMVHEGMLIEFSLINVFVPFG
jgi:hypothetical protein